MFFSSFNINNLYCQSTTDASVFESVSMSTFLCQTENGHKKISSVDLLCTSLYDVRIKDGHTNIFIRKLLYDINNKNEWNMIVLKTQLLHLNSN